MKKKIILISAFSIFTAVAVTVAVFFNITAKYHIRKTAAEYIEYPITKNTSVNEKMQDMKNSISGKISFEPTVTYTEEIELTPNSKESADANSKALNKVIKSAKNGTKITIPSGRYYISAPIEISQKSNLVITASGSGALLINTYYTPFEQNDKQNTPNVFNIFACENLRIENVSFDYLRHVSAEGIIVKQFEDGTCFKLYDEYTNGEKTELTGGEAVTTVFTANDQGFLEENWPPNSIELQKQDDGMFYIPLKIGAVGDKIACRFKSSGTYVTYVIHAKNTNGLILENLRCYSCPGGFVFAADGNGDLYFKNLQIKVKDGSERLLGSNEDCLHLRDVQGSLTVVDSTFWGIGDDALNIHTGLATVTKVDKNSVTANLSGTSVKKGETIEFFDSNYNSLGVANAKAVRRNKIRFDSLPKNISSALYMQNVSLSPDTVVSNCEIGFARARGLLIQSKNSLVEKCSFKNVRLAAILSAPDFGYWLEGGFCDNLLIESNTFDNCASLQNGMGVIHITAGHDSVSGNIACTKGHKNISVINNVFKNSEGENIKANNVLNLKTQ